MIPHPEQYVRKKKREDKDTNELTYIWNSRKPTKFIEKEIIFVITRGTGGLRGNWRKVVKMVQTSSYQINKN